MTKKTKRILSILLSVAFGVIILLGSLQICVNVTHDSWEHWKPNYEKQDIKAILAKKQLSDEDYDLLFSQTGLTRLGIDGLLSADRKDRILTIQDFYFKDVEKGCKQFAPYTYLEEMEEYGPYCALEKGDIIVSATTHCLFMRVGHAVIIVEENVVGEKAKMVESASPGTKSKMLLAGTGANLSNYMVLRPTGIPVETREKAAKYTKDELIDLPYDATIGILSKKFPETAKKTQCAHLCWYAYQKFGYDIDGNGGGLVKPQDIANSEYMEVVQIYGFNPQTLWK